MVGKVAVSGGNTAAQEGSGWRAVLPGDERAATLNGADQAPGAEFFHGPADSAVRHAIAAGRFPLGEQPCPGLELPGYDADGEVVRDGHVGKIRAPPGGRLKITHVPPCCLHLADVSGTSR